MARLLASGRDADVHLMSDGIVRRRYRDARAVTTEAMVMSHALRSGFPVPAVEHADGPDLFMEHVPGPTMLQALASDPASVDAYAVTLAGLHARLHRIGAPPGLRVHGRGTALLHLDLHPANVIMSAHGPVVIDWTNAAGGDAELDVALSWLIVATAQLPAHAADELSALRDRFARAFADTIGRDAIRAGLPGAAAFRLADPNISDDERATVRAARLE